MRIIYFSSRERSITGAVVAIVLGGVLVAWPVHVLDYMVKVIGATFCVVGIVSLLARERSRAGGLVSASGVGSVVLGVVLWWMSGTFTSVLIYLLGFLLVLAGVGQLSLLLAARKWGRVPGLTYLFPVITLASGIVIIANPFQARETIVILFGIAAMLWGASQLVNHFTIYKARERGRQEPDVVDTDYEEV
jgi:uncharacterized membrane protein HdeD (DUF308 family)